MVIAKDETDMHMIMGDKYHVCSECSTDSNSKVRELCRRSNPVTLGDLEDMLDTICLHLGDIERRTKGYCRYAAIERLGM